MAEIARQPGVGTSAIGVARSSLSRGRTASWKYRHLGFSMSEKDAAAAADFSFTQHQFLTPFDSPRQSAHSVAARNFTQDWIYFLILGI